MSPDTSRKPPSSSPRAWTNSSASQVLATLIQLSFRHGSCFPLLRIIVLSAETTFLLVTMCCICICTDTPIKTRIHTHTCMHACIQTHLHTPMQSYKQADIVTQIRACRHACLHSNTLAYTHSFIQACLHTYYLAFVHMYRTRYIWTISTLFSHANHYLNWVFCVDDDDDAFL
jgi:hypothetical protein